MFPSLKLWAVLAVAWKSVEAGHYDVTVGKDGQLAFVPDSLNATIGDTVTYHFFAKVFQSRLQSSRPVD